jgi:hypothetical protein
MRGYLGYRGYLRTRKHRLPPPISVATGTLAVAALAAGCSAPSPHPSAVTFTPGASAGTGATAAPSASASSSGGTGADDFVMPPFGSNVRVTMTDYLPPAGSPLIPAVVTTKNWFLAYYYSQYKGGTDKRWVTYTAGNAQPIIEKNLEASDVAGESFIGSLSFGAMSAEPDPKIAGYIDVKICIDASKLTDTSLSTGKVLPTQPASGHTDYKTMAYVAKGSTGLWYVAGLTNPILVPAAEGCTS